MHSFPKPKADWPLISALLCISAIPIAAGLRRLLALAFNDSQMVDDIRFVSEPMPVVMHIICASIYATLGVFQLAPNIRNQNLGRHRTIGKYVALCGLIVAASGLWMNQYYPTAQFDGLFVYELRSFAGWGMVLCIVLGISAIRRGRIVSHQAWMVRAYAVGLGAGTQVFTHIPWFLFPSLRGEVARTLALASGWIINIAVAEWLIRNRCTRRT